MQSSRVRGPLAGLHPQVAQILREMELADEPEWSSLKEMRRAVNLAVRELSGPPPTLAQTQDAIIPGSGGAIPLRIYRPGRRSMATVVFFHGGGWVFGDLEAYDPFCHHLAHETGCGIVSVAYRLAPEQKYPAATQDAWAAVQWVADHAGELGGDKEQIAVAGESAGGNLAAAVCLMARDRGAPALCHQLLLYPVLDLASFRRPSYRSYGTLETLSQERMEWFREQYLGPRADPLDPHVSPSRAASLSHLPPTTLVSAGHDVLRDEGQAYVRRLQRAGVPATWLCYPDMTHGFLNMGLRVDRAGQALAEIGSVLRRALRGGRANSRAMR